ncbi:Fused isobutyryl-CoA mutase [subsurface metagenome]
MANRGQLGGLARATEDSIKILDAYGCDVVIVETVGVGQSEVDIFKSAHTVVVLLVPGLGDDIQAIKAGIMEITDVFVVNKMDLSPNKAPPVKGDDGSTQIIPIFLPCLTKNFVKFEIKVDFPLPGAPVTPKIYAFPVFLYITLTISSAASISFSTKVIRRAAALVFPSSNFSIKSE